MRWSLMAVSLRTLLPRTARASRRAARRPRQAGLVAGLRDESLASQPHSVATCGSSSPRCQPRSTTRPWRPISMSCGPAIGSSGPSSEISMSIASSSDAVTGGNRGSLLQAATAHRGTTCAERFGRLDVPDAAAQLAVLCRVTKAPPGRDRIAGSRIGGRAESGRDGCDVRRRSPRARSAAAARRSASLRHAERCPTRRRDSRPPTTCRRRRRPSRRSAASARRARRARAPRASPRPSGRRRRRAAGRASSARCSPSASNRDTQSMTTASSAPAVAASW